MPGTGGGHMVRRKICCKCDKGIDIDNDGYATRLIDYDNGKPLVRVYYCGGCVIVGKFP